MFFCCCKLNKTLKTKIILIYRLKCCHGFGLYLAHKGLERTKDKPLFSLSKVLSLSATSVGWPQKLKHSWVDINPGVLSKYEVNMTPPLVWHQILVHKWH